MYTYTHTQLSRTRNLIDNDKMSTMRYVKEIDTVQRKNSDQVCICMCMCMCMQSLHVCMCMCQGNRHRQAKQLSSGVYVRNLCIYACASVKKWILFIE
jgi:hypothetical protein